MNSVDGEVSMPSIQRIFQKSIFLITITCLLITLTDVKCSGFSEEKSTEAESLPLKTVRILSLDGGGVRGISEARFLEHLETSLGMPISSAFHLIGGTSAGGILSTFLTTPAEPGSTQPKYSAGELVQILQQRSPDMFVQRYLSCYGLFGPKYRTDRFRSVLSEYLGHTTVNDAITPTAVVAFDMVRQNLKTITSWDTGEIFTKVNAISSTAAAASYFEPCHAIPTNHAQTSYFLTDGGIGANNPTLCLIAEAKKLYPEANNFEIISVGSGRADKPLHFKKMKRAGLVHWAPHLPRMFMDGETSKDHTFLSEAFLRRTDADGVEHSAFKGNYSRWSPLLNYENTQLDDTTSTNLQAILKATDLHIELRREEYNALVTRLSVPKTRF